MNGIVYKDEQTVHIPTEFPSQIKGIIADLRSTIDQLNSNFKNAKELITELATRLDEDRISERSTISRVIKQVLEDKILEGKITAKWIEKCLPAKYKRSYSKSEQNSLSKKYKKPQEMVIDKSGNVLAEMESPSISDIGKTSFGESSLKKKKLENLGSYRDEVRCPNCSQLEDALRMTSPILTAEYLAESEIRIPVTRDKYKELSSIMERSSDFFHIILDRTSQRFVRAELDMNDLI